MQEEEAVLFTWNERRVCGDGSISEVHRRGVNQQAAMRDRKERKLKTKKGDRF